MTSDIVNTLSGYATLDSPAFLGYATLNGNMILAQTDHCAPAIANVGRYIELDVQVANEARLDFHLLDNSTGMDYDSRIVCNGGIANDICGGTLSILLSSSFTVDQWYIYLSQTQHQHSVTTLPVEPTT